MRERSKQGCEGALVNHQQGGSTMLKQLKSQKGFTLIELMIVVAIIGILAAIAIPNFIAYQAKSKQAEAKVSLGAIFTSVVAFQAESNPQTYLATNINQIGYQPSGSPRYKFWYYAGTGAAQFPGSLSVATPCDTTPTTTNAVLSSVTGFTAGAKGNIDGDLACDEWFMNDVRNLTNGKNDVSETS
jgi:type IV pilus assembly protein PilA